MASLASQDPLDNADLGHTGIGHMPPVYMSEYQPTPMQPWTDANASGHTVAEALEVRISQLSSLQRQTVLALLAATDRPPGAASSSSTPYDQVPWTHANQSSNLEAILGMISSLRPSETQALIASLNHTSDVNQSTPLGPAWGEKPAQDAHPPAYRV